MFNILTRKKAKEMRGYTFSNDGSLIAHISSEKKNQVTLLQGNTGVKLSQIKIPYKVNSNISAMSIIEPSNKQHQQHNKKLKFSSFDVLIALSNGELFHFSEDGRLQKSKKLSAENIYFITNSFIGTRNKIYQLPSMKLLSEKYVCNGFYESVASGEVYISELSHVMILSNQLEEKAQVNIPSEHLIWGGNGIVVTAGRSINIGNLHGHTKSISLSSPAQSLSCQLSEKFLDIVVSTKSHKCFFARIELANNLKNANIVHCIEMEQPEIEACTIFGTRIRAIKSGGSAVLDCVYQDQANYLIPNFTFTSISPNADIETMKKAKNKTQTAVLGRVNQTLPNAQYRFVNLTDKTSLQVSNEGEDEDNDEKMNMDVQDKSVPEMQISGALIRALQRGNIANIEKIVEVDNQELITKTVKQVPSYLCIAFLSHLIQMYTNRSYSAKACTTLLKWIQTIFTVKATLFMGRRDILEIASPLYNTLDAKLDSLNLLLDLSGRLELVLEMSGISDVHDAQSTKKKLQPQSKLYESDNEDDMDAFVERYKKANGNIEESEDEFDEIDEEEQQQEEDKRDGAAYQDKRGWFDVSNQNLDELSDEELELERALQEKEKELLREDGDIEDDLNAEKLTDDYEEDYVNGDDQEEEEEDGEEMEESDE